MGLLLGYVRVSTTDQHGAAQRDALLEAGVEEKYIYAVCCRRERLPSVSPRPSAGRATLYHYLKMYGLEAPVEGEAHLPVGPGKSRYPAKKKVPVRR